MGQKQVQHHQQLAVSALSQRDARLPRLPSQVKTGALSEDLSDSQWVNSSSASLSISCDCYIFVCITFMFITFLIISFVCIADVCISFIFITCMHIKFLCVLNFCVYYICIVTFNVCVPFVITCITFVCYRCMFDACACDSGGDCECLCTAIAAFAHECAAQGVPIKWRTPTLCRKLWPYCLVQWQFLIWKILSISCRDFLSACP